MSGRPEASVLAALYEGKKIALRLYTWPEGDERNFEVMSGDFASAYDHAVRECGWKSLALTPRPLSKMPEIYRAERGYISASFASTWNVTWIPEFRSCELRGPRSAGWFAVHGRLGDEQSRVLPLGDVIVMDSEGRVVERFSHREFGPAPLDRLLRAAERAGENGMVKVGGEMGSLFGLAEAVRFAEQTCGMRLRTP